MTGEQTLVAQASVPNSTRDALVRSRPARVLTGLIAGVSLTACGASEVDGSAAAATTHSSTPPEERSATAVYYQPRESDLHDPRSLEVSEIAKYIMVAEPGLPNSWTSEGGNCSPENADNFLDNKKTKNAHTLAGFSLGRVGVSYFMQQATPEQQAAIDSIVLVAPGNQEDFTDSCDPADTSAMMDRWLQLGDKKHLVIIADNRTAEQDFAGIRELYLDGLTDGVVDRVAVCVTGLGHEEAWNDSKEEIFAKPPSQSCNADQPIYDDWRQ